MKLNLDRPSSSYSIRAYGTGAVTVRLPGPEGTLAEVDESFVLTPDRLIRPWAPGAFDALTVDHFETLTTLGTEFVLFGSGSRLRFPSSVLTAPLTRAGIAIEVMDTGAACRTYNVLAAEGRSVAVALLMIGEL